MKKYPKVLVISHNPFSDTQNNGKTLSAFFKGWPKDNIAQLYLTLDEFDTTVCEKFYRITDVDVLKSFFKKECHGREYVKNDNNINNKKEKQELHKNKIYTFIRDMFKKRLPIMYCLRNLAWKMSKPWKNKEINNWINKFNPDLVFFQSSNVFSIFDMVLDICKDRNIPLIMETTDDYVTKRFSIDPFFWIDHGIMVDRYKKAIEYAKCTFAIGDMMAKEYTERFGGNFKVAMNCIDIKDKVTPYVSKKDKVKFLYAGNLGLNRWKILYKIGKTLVKIKEHKNIDIEFDIYSIELPKERILKKLNLEYVMQYKGSLNSEQLIQKRNESDVLVHVESFDKKNKYITRLSISTKIPEYMASQRCILAVGPNDVASIKYLNDEKLAQIVTRFNKKELNDKILQIIEKSELREKMSKRCLKKVAERHDLNKTIEIIQNEIIQSVYEIN